MENQIAAPGQGFHILTDCLKDEAKLAGCVQIIAGLRKALNRTIGAISHAFFSSSILCLHSIARANLNKSKKVLTNTTVASKYIPSTVPLGDWLEKKKVTAIIIKQQFGFPMSTT